MKKRLYLGFIGIALALSACDDNVPSGIEFDNFLQVYYDRADIIAQNIVLSATKNDTTLEIGSIHYGGTTNFNKPAIEANVEIDNSLISAFNIANSATYEALPDGACSLSSSKLTIESGKSFSNQLSLTIKPSLLNDGKSYLIPVAVKSVSGDLKLNAEKSVAYFTFAVPKQDIHKDKWTIDSHFNTWAAGYEPEKAINGNIDDCWHTGTSNAYPYWVIIDFHSSLEVEGILWWNRNRVSDPNAVNFPKDVVFQMSDDKSAWTTILSTTIPNIKEGEQNLPCTTPATGRYLKITINNSYGGAGYTYIGEVSVY